MISITLPKSANLRVALILLAAVAATPGFTQSRFGADADRQQEIVERIALEEARSGPYSEDLIAPLSDLALLYQDRGEHDLAGAAITRARQVVRANEGLHSLEQIPLLQQLIANEEVLGRLETANELEQELLTLAKRHPDDLRTVPVFREIAAKRMTLLRQYLAGEFPPQMVLGCYHGWPRGGVYQGSINRDSTSCIAGNRNDAIRTIVADAQTNYAAAIAVMLRKGLYWSDELQSLELELVRSIDVLRDRGAHDQRFRDSGLTEARLDLEPWRSWWDAVRPLAEWELAQPPASSEQGEQPAGQQKPSEPATELGQVTHPSAELVDYGFGRKSLERLLAYEKATSAPLPEQIAALVRVADWDLLYSYNSRALGQYERAHELLKQAGAPASIAELFSPITPVVLPTFVPNPLDSDATEASTRYIDVAFEVSRYGDSRRIEILDTTMNATDADKTHLVRLIQRSRFRPRLTEGELARASPVVLRYYLPE
jgi:tetratricopeptide (TPR) repeat protein